ncbi:MAG: hypothetical protein QME94_05455 [Anaerolineae bacterium]|nr:hypothetical protein [Anaerolineae bacterium]
MPLEAAREHWQHCPECRRRLAALAHAVLSGSEDIPCAECQGHWPALLHARLEGRSATGPLRLVAAHLAHCHACSESFEALLQAVSLEEQGALEEPPGYPRFDLSFLERKPLWTPADASRQAARQVRQLAEEVALRVRVLKRGLEASFTGLPTGLRPVPVAVQATRRGSRAPGQRLSLPDPAANVAVTLTVQAAGAGRSHLSVELRELEPDRPLPRARASLLSSSGQEVVPLRQGRATFAGLEPAHYVLEMLVASSDGAERVWRLPIDVQAL